MTDKPDYFQSNGVVTQARGNGNFLVKIPDLDDPVSCTLSGKIRKNTIKILQDDKVSVEVSTYDPSKGRITYRYKK